jgi:hypothetical protein
MAILLDTLLDPVHRNEEFERRIKKNIAPETTMRTQACEKGKV